MATVEQVGIIHCTKNDIRTLRRTKDIAQAAWNSIAPDRPTAGQRHARDLSMNLRRAVEEFLKFTVEIE